MKNSDQTISEISLQVRVRNWFSNFGDLLVLVILFFVLLFTIMWASDKNIYQQKALVSDAVYSELKTFCEVNLHPDDYVLEQSFSTVRIHLPMDKWFISGTSDLLPEKQEVLKRLAQKITKLKITGAIAGGDSINSENIPAGQPSIRLQIDNKASTASDVTRSSHKDLAEVRTEHLVHFLNGNAPNLHCHIDENDSPSNFLRFLTNNSDKRSRSSSPEVTMLITAAFIER